MRAMFVMIFMAVYLSVITVVASVITVTDFAGKPVKGARVFYVHPVKKVYVTQDTDEGGKVTLTSAYLMLPGLNSAGTLPAIALTLITSGSSSGPNGSKLCFRTGSRSHQRTPPSSAG